MGTPVIETRGLGKDYVMGDVVVHALRDATVTIEEGEFVALMGPSGAGKSTFMNLAGCLDRPSSGEYFLKGQNVADMNDNELVARSICTRTSECRFQVDLVRFGRTPPRPLAIRSRLPPPTSVRQRKTMN